MTPHSPHTKSRWLISKSDPHVILTCHGPMRVVAEDTTGKLTAEIAANVALMVAAPLMLAALEWVRRGARDDEPEMWAAVDEAIAKGRGK